MSESIVQIVLVVSVTAVLGKTADIQEARPANVTVDKGQRAMFDCSGSQVSWTKAPRTKIFTSPDTWNDQIRSKYEIIGNYSLEVKAADPNSDAGTYICNTDEDESKTFHADLVVVGNFIVKFTHHMYIIQ